MKKLIIFDLDGTLLNTIADLAQSTNYALQALGYPTHPESDYNFMVGNGINKLFERALPEGEKSEENVLRVRKEFVPYYDVHNADKSRPYPGIPELLEQLQEKGMILAVASNKYQSATVKLISHYFPHIRFTAVFGQREGVNVKPDPTVVHDIWTSPGYPVKTCYMWETPEWICRRPPMPESLPAESPGDSVLAQNWKSFIRHIS